MHTLGPDHLVLQTLLRERNQHPERAVDIDLEISARFGRSTAVLVLDMSGFSSGTTSHGIVHFLARIQQMRDAVDPVVIGNGGQPIKYEADNAFALFPDVRRAVDAALDTHRSLDAMNHVLPEHLHVKVSIGIGYGHVLVLDDSDLFGDEVNRACKLGEDIAVAGETLLTDSAAQTVADACALRRHKRVIGEILVHYASVAQQSVAHPT